MTLVLKPHLDIVVTYLHTKYEVNRSICSKVMVTEADRLTDMCKTFTYPLSRAVNIDCNQKWTTVSRFIGDTQRFPISLIFYTQVLSIKESYFSGQFLNPKQNK